MTEGIERTSDLVVVACGALSSALLMLRSANDAHPQGLANASGLVGRNYLRHNHSTVLAISRALSMASRPERRSIDRGSRLLGTSRTIVVRDGRPESWQRGSGRSP